MDFITALWLLLATQTVEVTTIKPIAVHEQVSVPANKSQPILTTKGSEPSDKVSRNPKIQQDSNKQDSKTFQGKVSTYTATYGGCLSCTKHYDEKGQLYFITASGDRLDDSKFTLAFNKLPLGSRVSVTNLNNYKSVGAVVNDRGGFEPLGRIADLSLATAVSIGARTGNSFDGSGDTIEIKALE